jgi:hypothetical protein
MSKPPTGLQTEMSNRLVAAAASAHGPCYHDAWVWEQTIRYPTHPWQATLLKRIFTAMRFGGLYYQNAFGMWKPWVLPICSSISHGGRVMFQYKSGTGFSFWSWIQGLDLGNAGKFAIDWRAAATHGADLNMSGTKVIVKNAKHVVEKKFSGLSKPKSFKLLNPLKGDYGVNLPMGGDAAVRKEARALSRAAPAVTNNQPLDPYIWNNIGANISSDGSFGHLYIYHEAAVVAPASVVMVGLESSGSGAKSVMGKVHDASGGSGLISGAYGVKFTHTAFDRVNNQARGDQHSPVPKEYDAMFVGLGRQWQRDIAGQVDNWDYAWLAQPTAPIANTPKLPSED